MTADRGSIRQNPAPPALPDLCNIGIALRVLLMVNTLALLGALLRDSAPDTLTQRCLLLAGWVEPILILSLPALCLARLWLNRLPFRSTLPAAALFVGLIAHFYARLMADIMIEGPSLWQVTWWSALIAAAVLYWLSLLQQARSPSLAEARLLALTARIRPHFLFNSLNAILGVIRADPRRAEAALEELSELFRALMHDPRDLVLLSDEIALARRYLELERLRLGDRLQVAWDVESCAPDALMPAMMLQPLLENAVYHGIEPAEAPGAISIRLAHVGGEIQIELANPLVPGHVHGRGNQMALSNIRERLMLFFDIEAALVTEIDAQSYRVRTTMPYRRNTP